MTIRAEISEADVVRVEPGQEVSLHHPRRAGPSLPTPPALDRAGAGIGQDRQQLLHRQHHDQLDVLLLVHVLGGDLATTASSTCRTPTGRLRTYMTAEVHIVLGEARNVLTVPAAALAGPEADGSFSVRVVEADGTVARRPVEVGLDNKIAAEIRDGLKAGERVVIGEAATASRTMMGPPPGGM